jgi:dihydroorotase
MTQPQFDLVLRGGTVVDHAGRRRADVAIRDERIAAIAEPDTPVIAARELGVGGLYVLPGLVDLHSHHREPGFTHKEDIISATRQCAAGGITTTFAMPNVDPPPNTAEQLAAMLELYRSRAIVDYNVNAAGTIPTELAGMAAQGIAAFKVFMVVDTGRSYPHMPGIGVHDHGDLLAICESVASTNLTLMVHPHDQAVMSWIERAFWERGERDFRAYAKAYASHDGLIWNTAVAVLLELQRASGVKLHLLHTQTRGVLEQLRRAKANRATVTAEINPWALFLGHDWQNIERLGSYALSYWVPPENDAALWDALRDGTIDVFASDHAPHTREEKEPGWTDGWKAHTGTPSAQYYLALLLDAAANGKITLERIVEVAARAPADLVGLRRKGRIQVGADADIVIVDLDRTTEVTNASVLSKCGWTPYADRSLHGGVVSTLVRGRVVFDQGNVMGEPGWGRQARPTPAGPEGPGEL